MFDEWYVWWCVLVVEKHGEAQVSSVGGRRGEQHAPCRVEEKRRRWHRQNCQRPVDISSDTSRLYADAARLCADTIGAQPVQCPEMADWAGSAFLLRLCKFSGCRWLTVQKSFEFLSLSADMVKGKGLTAFHSAVYISLMGVCLSGKKMRWHFSEQRWEWSDGCVMLR